MTQVRHPQDTTVSPGLAAADRALQSRHFPEAIELYAKHLAAVPDDVPALLKLGICHLLNRSEHRFLEIHAQARSLLAALPDVPAEVETLWRKYEGLAVKVTAGAMIIGGLTMAGCSQATENSGNAAPAQNPATPGNTNAATPAAPVKPAHSSHRYSGGVYQPPQAVPSTNRPSTSSHKYSGGVYLAPRPSGHETV